MNHMQTTEDFVHLGLGWIGDRGGGLERYQDGICRAHAGLGQSVTAWVQSRVPIAGDHGYRVVAYASPEEPRRTKLSKLTELAASRLPGCDSVFVSHHASVSALLLPLLREMPHVVHFQGPWAEEATIEGAPLWKTWLQRRQERRVYQSADRIITLSTAFKELVVDRYGVQADCVTVVPGAIDALAADPGVSRSEARARLGWPTDRRIVICIRRLVRRVGVLELITAAELVRQTHPDVLFMIGGTGPLKDELAAKIDSLGLSDHVRLLGFVADADLQTAYRAADYSIVPTQSLEGFGLVTLESMAAGTPSIVTPVGSLPEVMSGLSDSLILPGKDPTSIAEGVSRILGGELAVPDAEACKRYVRDHYDWSVIAPRVLDVYRGK